jgi:excisionase family DNA binding protein
VAEKWTPEDAGPDRLLTPQDVADLISKWLELAAPCYIGAKTAGVTGRLLKAREVAEFIAVSPATVVRWAREGKLPAFKLANGAVRFREDEFAEWLEQSRVVSKKSRA